MYLGDISLLVIHRRGKGGSKYSGNIRSASTRRRNDLGEMGKWGGGDKVYQACLKVEVESFIPAIGTEYYGRS